MAQDTVVEVDEEFGNALLHNLEQQGIPIAVAFWGKLEEYGEWRFFLASAELDKMGRFQAYSRIAGSGNAEYVFNRHLVTILSMDDPIVVGLRTSFLTEKEQIHGVRVRDLGFGARVVEDGILEKVA